MFVIILSFWTSDSVCVKHLFSSKESLSEMKSSDDSFLLMVL